MKKLTAIILSTCLEVAGLTGCQVEASEILAVLSQATDTGRQQAEKEPREETKGREDPAGEPDAFQPGSTAIITDHASSQVEIPREVNRVVVTDILPLPPIITVSLGSGEEIVGVASASMSAAKTGLLGELFPDILSVSTGFTNGNDIDMEEPMKSESDVVFCNAGSRGVGKALYSAGPATVTVSVNKQNYDSIETYNQWVSLLSQIFPEKGNTTEQVSRCSQNIYGDIRSKVSGLEGEEKKDILSLFNYSDTTMVALGKKFFGQFWCDTVGGRNVAGGVAAENSNAVVSMEQIYEWNPDIIFTTNFIPIQSEGPYENAVRQSDWSPVEAMQDRNVYKLPLGTYRSYTPSVDTPMTLLWMIEQVYPDLSSDVDMTQEVKDYHKELYDVDLNGEQVQRIYHPGRETAAGYGKQALMHRAGMI